MKRKNGKKRGFTLIELLVVISIIAVLSSIVLAALSTARAKASVAAGETFENQLYQAYGINAVAIWNFDDGAGSATAADSSGNKNNLTISSPAALESTNVFRGASALFIPSTDTASMVTPTLSTFNVADGSISFWIDLSQGGDQEGVFCSSSYFYFCIVSSDTITGNFIQVNWKNSSGTNFNFKTSISVASVIGIWTQVAVSWSLAGGTMNIYVNGSQVATYPYNTTTNNDEASIPVSIPPLTFCVGGDCAGDDMYGYLDELRVYSQSLQTGEIEKIYAEELPRHEHMLADVTASIHN